MTEETGAVLQQTKEQHEAGVYNSPTGIIYVFYHLDEKIWKYRKVEGRKSKKFMSLKSWPMLDWWWERITKHQDSDKLVRDLR